MLSRRRVVALFGCDSHSLDLLLSAASHLLSLSLSLLISLSLSLCLPPALPRLGAISHWSRAASSSVLAASSCLRLRVTVGSAVRRRPTSRLMLITADPSSGLDSCPESGKKVLYAEC